MTEFFAQPDDLGEPRASELHTSMGESLFAQGAEAFMGGTRQLFRIGEYSRANAAARPDQDEFSLRMFHGVGHPDVAPAEIPIDDAKKRVKDEGLAGELTLPDQPTIRAPVLDLMIDHAHERRDYNAAVARGPQGFGPGALGFVTQIGAGIVDPVSLAAFSFPVMGEARMGALMAGAGESLAARAGIRAGVGAVQGAVGSAALEPGDWWLKTQDGQDWTYRDALRNVALGAAMGGVMHGGIGVLGDLRARAAGLPLEHSAEDQVVRALAEAQERRPGEPLSGEGIEPGTSPEVPGGPRAADFEGVDLAHAFPDEIFADLPPAAREDLVRAAAADVMADRPGRAGDVLAIAAEQDPRIAESARPAAAPDPILAPALEQVRALGTPMDIAERWARDPEGTRAAVEEVLQAVRAAEKGLRERHGVKRTEDLEDAPLSKAESDFLFYGKDHTDPEFWREMRAQLQPVDSLQEAAREIAHEFKRLPKDTSKLSSGDDLVLARLQVLFSEVNRLGGDVHAVLRDAAQHYGAKFGDPEDAIFMVQNAAERMREMMRPPTELPGVLPRAGAADEFRRLAEPRPDPEARAEIEASKAAEAEPEPASVDPTRTVSEAEAKAAEADALLKDMDLTEEERTRVDDALRELAADQKAQEQMLRDGAACLIEAIA